MRELKSQISATLITLGDFFKSNRPSDMESITALAKCMQKLIVESGGGVKSDVLPSTEKALANLKASTRKCGRGRGVVVLSKSLVTCPRFVAAKLAYTQHLRRVMYTQSCQVGCSAAVRSSVVRMAELLLWFSIDAGMFLVTQGLRKCERQRKVY